MKVFLGISAYTMIREAVNIKNGNLEIEIKLEQAYNKVGTERRTM